MFLDPVTVGLDLSQDDGSEEAATAHGKTHHSCLKPLTILEANQRTAGISLKIERRALFKVFIYHFVYIAC